MGSIYRPTKTIAMPKNAVIRSQTVSWTDARGKKHSGKLTAKNRVLVQTRIWVAEWTDENGVRRKESTKCTSKEMALHWLHNKEMEGARIRAGVTTRKETDTAENLCKPLKEHIAAFKVHLESKGRSKCHIDATINHLSTLSREARVSTLFDFTREVIDQWTANQKKPEFAINRHPTNKTPKNLSNRSINAYLTSCVSFFDWCVVVGRMAVSPLKGRKQLNTDIDRQRVRRALTEDEVQRLYEAALTRKRLGKLTGEEVELIYRTLFGTGLRHKELSSLKVHQISFERRYILVEAFDTKGKRQDRQPIAGQLAERLAAWIKSQNKTPGDKLFHCNTSMIGGTFRRDLKLAGIPAKGEDGRVVDAYCLRRTYGTMLARAGVPIATTQKLMRHRHVETTVKIYIDVEDVDTADALGKLPKNL